jgi:hypothetical protein
MAVPLRSTISKLEDSVTAKYELIAAGRTQTLTVTGSKPASCPRPDSIEHFFKEHQWGFGTTRRGSLLRYEVVHPIWDIYSVTSHQLDWDWGSVYGEEWIVLQDAQPCSVIMAAGSKVAVYPGKTVCA